MHFLRQIPFSILLVLALALGLLFPPLERLPKTLLPAVMACIIFVSCFRLTFAELRRVSFRRVMVFWLLRFLALPILLHALTLPIGDELATGVFLMTLMPAGVASPGLCVIHKGNASLALVLVVASSLAAPFVTPTYFELFGSDNVAVDPWRLFATLCLILALPFAARLLCQARRSLEHWMIDHSAVLVKPLILAAMTLGIAHQRSYLLSHVDDMPRILLAATVLYLTFYGVGWTFGWRERHENRIAYSLASGFNNNVLGVVLATLYLGPEVAAFAVMTLVAGVLGLILFGRLFDAAGLRVARGPVAAPAQNRT